MASPWPDVPQTSTSTALQLHCLNVLAPLRAFMHLLQPLTWTKMPECTGVRGADGQMAVAVSPNTQMAAVLSESFYTLW